MSMLGPTEAFQEEQKGGDCMRLGMCGCTCMASLQAGVQSEPAEG